MADKALRQRRLNSNSKTLYHQTDSSGWASISSSGQMRRGQQGMAGGGIYFATSIADTHRKAHNHGIIIKATVRLGSVKMVDENGADGVTFTTLQNEDYDSVMIPRMNGKEFVVYNYDQVQIDAYSDDNGNSWTSYSYRKSCRVPGCKTCLPGRAHYCLTCGDSDSDHRSSRCPSKSRGQNCRAPGCSACKPGKTHYCNHCGEQDSDHLSRNCPSKAGGGSTAGTETPATACRVTGCTDCKPGRAHYCKNCKSTDSDHRSSNCPSLTAESGSRCRVAGCTDCKPGRAHYCKNCKSTDSDHRSINCPLKSGGDATVFAFISRGP